MRSGTRLAGRSDRRYSGCTARGDTSEGERESEREYVHVHVHACVLVSLTVHLPKR